LDINCVKFLIKFSRNYCSKITNTPSFLHLYPQKKYQRRNQREREAVILRLLSIRLISNIRNNLINEKKYRTNNILVKLIVKMLAEHPNNESLIMKTKSIL